eukprot:TRINITY_DN325_c0_g1_i2.p1 TRINITY_DN325_c0_g1~~TRINITY_DN325_c0_g1_i2.p1  ORF type:complete len:177 (-),score=23.82 TRINITY_DN325_c0_g1_i2:741-1271(-)
MLGSATRRQPQLHLSSCRRSLQQASRQQRQAAAACGRGRQAQAYPYSVRSRAAAAVLGPYKSTSTCVPQISAAFAASGHPLLVPGQQQQRRSFTIGKPPAPVHETPHYMDFDTLVDMHLVTRQGFGDRPLFGYKRGEQFEWMTYKEFGKKVDVCRTALARMGIVRGDKVACISNNR